MTDIPSRSFGGNLACSCKKDTDLLNLFNTNPPFPNQASCTVFSPSNTASMKFISVLRMQHFEMGEWIQLKKEGKYVGKFCVPLSDLWEWSLGYSMPRTSIELGDSQDSQLAYTRAVMVQENKLKLAQSLGRSWTLTGRPLWPMKAIPQNLKAKKL